jgi:hypothetical protein
MRKKNEKQSKLEKLAFTPFSVQASVNNAYTKTRKRSFGNSGIYTSEVDRFPLINNYKLPFGTDGEWISVKPIINLCQKAYFHISLIRNVLDTMTELASANIRLRGGSKLARDFFEKAWFKKINLSKLQEGFFREYYRSGNCVLFKITATLTETDRKALSKNLSTAVSDTGIPIKYIILNPTEIVCQDGVNFSDTKYFKLLTPAELTSIKKLPKEEQEPYLKLFNINTIQELESQTGNVSIPLTPERATIVFYKKQDYEPFAVPMVYPVLDDLEWKLELKKMDRELARTTDWAILLVTMGSEKGFNQKNVKAMQELLNSDAIKRFIVSDYNTKGEWLIPDISAILGPEKYKQVNEDIRIGVNFALFGDEKFANSLIKTQIFLERLKEAQKTFIGEFLQPEIDKLHAQIGFKGDVPKAICEELNFKDEIQMARIYSRLRELGVLTPDELVYALETGILPEKIQSLENQREFKQHKDEGLFEPLIGNSAAKENGRPEGAKAPQTTKNVSPIGASVKFNFGKFKENITIANTLQDKIAKILKKKHGLNELNAQQTEAVEIVSKHLIVNENKEDWDKKVKEYVDNLPPIKEEAKAELNEIGANYNVSDYLAALLLKSVEK